VDAWTTEFHADQAILVGVLGSAEYLNFPPSRPRVLLVGDSLTQQYSVPFIALDTYEVAVFGGPGEDPANHPWADQVLVAVTAWRPDFVVLQDYSLPGIAPENITFDQYAAAMTQVAVIAGSRGALVDVLVGCCFPDLMHSLPADRWTDMVPADAPDGIHYAEAGAAAMADRLSHDLAGDPQVTTRATTADAGFRRLLPGEPAV
jgi:hypothetical protein